MVPCAPRVLVTSWCRSDKPSRALRLLVPTNNPLNPTQAGRRRPVPYGTWLALQVQCKSMHAHAATCLHTVFTESVMFTEQVRPVAQAVGWQLVMLVLQARPRGSTYRISSLDVLCCEQLPRIGRLNGRIHLLKGLHTCFIGGLEHGSTLHRKARQPGNPSYSG